MISPTDDSGVHLQRGGIGPKVCSLIALADAKCIPLSQVFSPFDAKKRSEVSIEEFNNALEALSLSSSKRIPFVRDSLRHEHTIRIRFNGREMQRAAALFVTSKIIDSTNTVISSAPTEDGIFVIHSKFAYACQRYAEKAMLCHRTTFVEEAETRELRSCAEN